ncbi:hypothetical protein [Gordonia soli]|uniref:hypothetical protein n=1 Tax=Gordonia soli TaxID=320799 RepID=UPI00059171C8|nr:hypothetical protein [Gordonia soli]
MNSRDDERARENRLAIAAVKQSVQSSVENERVTECAARDAEDRLRRATLEASDLFDSSPQLTHVAAFADARHVGRWAVLSGVLMRVVLALPHNVVLPAIIGSEVSINTFLALIGVSGGGKGSADKAAAEAFDIRIGAGDSEHLLPRQPMLPIGTGEGINRTYAKAGTDPVTGRYRVEFHERVGLFGVRDIATLSSLTARSGTTLVPELLKASMGEELGFANADKERRVILPMHSYRLCLSAGVQPDNGAILLNDQATTDGLPQRFLWAPVRDGVVRTDRAETAPRALVLPDFGIDPFAVPDDGGDNLDVPLVPIGVGTTIAEAVIAVDAAKDADMFGRSDDPLAGHRLLCQLKVATAFAVIHGRTYVGVEDWQRAECLMTVSTAAMAYVAAASSATAERESVSRGQLDGVRQAAADEVRAERQVRKVADRIREMLPADGDWMTINAIRKVITSSSRVHIEPAIHRLTVKGDIRSRKHEYGTGTTTQFSLTEKGRASRR